jgi:hypothetical protein
MAIVARLFLVAMDLIFGVVKVEHDDLGRLGVGGDKLIHQDYRETIKLSARHTIFKP